MERHGNSVLPFDAVQSGVVLVPIGCVLCCLTCLYGKTLLYHSSAEFESGLVFTRVMRMKKSGSTIDQLSIDTKTASQVRRLSGGNQPKGCD